MSYTKCTDWKIFDTINKKSYLKFLETILYFKCVIKRSHEHNKLTQCQTKWFWINYSGGTDKDRRKHNRYPMTRDVFSACLVRILWITTWASTCTCTISNQASSTAGLRKHTSQSLWSIWVFFVSSFFGV